MRLILPLLLIAGCGSSSSTHDMQTTAGPDMAVISCSQTVNAYCAAVGNCVRDANAAQQKATWCPAGGGGTATSVTVQHCGTQIVVIATYSDSADHLVYDSSNMLVAVFNSIPHSGDLSCVAGPTTIAAPMGCDTPTQICP